MRLPGWFCVVLTVGSFVHAASAQTTLETFHRSLTQPPDDCRIMMRWWWFGPSVAKPELTWELEQMKAGGIGGVEIATLYPQALDDPASGFANTTFLSSEHLDALRYAAAEAARLGMRVDITLGSGWPFGGPHIPVTQAAGQLRVERVSVPAHAESVAIPAISAGEQMLAAFLLPRADGNDPSARMEDARAAPKIHGGRLETTPATEQERTALFFIASRTGMTVKRAALGGEGFVLDHYDARATATHLQQVGDRLLSAFGEHPPYAVFSDSLEDYGSDWTPDFIDEFRRRRGYDITPYLPALIGDDGPLTAAVRHDWGQTLTALADDHFLAPLHEWASVHHTLFRSQTYGFPPVTLASNRYADLPEGEGKATLNMWREFSDTRWATSAAHLFGRNVVSSETWTWLHSPAFRASPLDMKAEADLHFLQGINQLVGHGWPYSPSSAEEPGWRMYAAGALNAHNPWYFAMPDLTRYLQRVSFAMRQGKPVTDVALLLPNDDVWASFHARLAKKQSPTSAAGFDESGSNVTIDESMPEFLGKDVIAQVLDAGFGLDFIDADTIDTVGIPYKVLILPGVDRLPVASYGRILAFAQRGGIVIATRRLPATSPGLLHREADSASIADISRTLFGGALPNARLVPDERTLGASLATMLQPDVVLTPANHAVGFIHRAFGLGDLYFLANTSNQPQQVTAQFRARHRYGEVWDAMTDEASVLAHPDAAHLVLAPYESRIVLLTDTPPSTSPRMRTLGPPKRVDLGHAWKVSVQPEVHVQPFQMSTLHPVNEEAALRYYSGEIVYEKSIEVPAHTDVTLDFGDGTPVPLPAELPRFNMRAYLEGPVREAAQVFVNCESAGFVWHPPYRLDLTSHLKPGVNQLRIVVGNSAINAMAGRSQPDKRLLDARYGLRFVPQDMDNLQPLPSGIVGRPTLEERRVLRGSKSK